MDVNDIQSDLHALIRLYGLLKKDGHATSNSPTDLLDEHARALLKSLLDAATKRVLKEHSEMIACQLEAPGGTQLQQQDESSNKQPCLISKSSVAAQGCPSRANEMEKVDGLDISFWNANIFNPLWRRAGAVEQPVRTVKRCRLCRRNTINQMEPSEETHFHDDAQHSKLFSDIQHQHAPGSLLSNKLDESINNKLRPSDIETTSELEDFDCLSKEASEAIKQIESCISALHIRADPMETFAQHGQYDGVTSVDNSQIEETSMSRRNFPSEFSSQSMMERPVGYLLHHGPRISAEEMNQPYWLLNQTSKLVQPIKTVSTQSTNNFMSRGPGLGIDASCELDELIEESNFPTKKAKAIIESGNWIMSHYDFMPTRIHNVQNFSAQMDPSETSCISPTWPATFSAPSKMEGFMCPNNNENVDLGFNVSSSLGPRGKNHPPNSMRKEIQLDKKPSRLFPKNKQYITARQESDGTATDSYSNRSGQQTSSLGSDSEEYSLTDETREYLTSSTWSDESGASSQSNGTNSQYNSYTDNIEDGGDSSTSSVSIASSKTKGYSSTSKKSGPNKIRRANGKINRKKQTGMWKRMKDKLAIIFHHHHHHHHHHHDHDDRDDDKKKMSHKGKVNSFNRRDEEAYGEKAVEKVNKSIIIREKNQQGHFHGLMEGLLRHVRHSKRSKARKETFDKLGKGHHSRSRTLKRSHWWKLLQHHRRRKLPNKTHVKLGLGKKKARLKALPYMK